MWVNHVLLLFSPGAHKRGEAAPRSIQHCMIVWNSHVLTTAARLCPYLDHSYITSTTEATQVYNYCCSDCLIWSTTERLTLQFRTTVLPSWTLLGADSRHLWAPVFAQDCKLSHETQ